MATLRSRISIKWITPLALVLPVVIVAVVLTLLAYATGKRTADELAGQSMDQIHERIEEHLTQLMDMPPAINALNKRMLEKGQLSLSDVARDRSTAFEQLKVFPDVSSVVLGKATGETMWVIRYPGETTYEYAVKLSPTAPMEEYALDANGNIVGDRRSQYDFHPTRRPWYKDAIAAGGPTWGSVYIWVRNGKGETLGVPYVEPYRAPDGTILGVINCELTLADISAFLGQLRVGKTGKAFIIEPDGNLIATSANIPCMKNNTERLPVGEAADPWIAQAGHELRKRLGSSIQMNKPYSAVVTIDGEPMRLEVSPYAHQRGLNWLIATIVPESDFLGGVEATRQKSLFVGLAAVGLAVLLGVVLAIGMVRPILKLVGHVRRIGGGDLNCEIQLNNSKEFANLSQEINAMTDGLRDRMKLRQALAVAMDVQQSLLPSETPNVRGLDIAGHSTYCDETGGDYYDYLDVMGLSETTAAVAVGDVVGHGVAAAMLMASARGVLRSHCGETNSLSGLLDHLNTHLVRDVGPDSGRFMTMLLLTLDAEKKELRFASAGHDAPIAYDGREDRFLEFDAGGLPLGIMEDAEYEECALNEIHSQQVFLVGTDGIWEAHNVHEEMFGKDRIREILKANADRSAAEISETLREELARFCHDCKQEDDITFVVIKVL